MKTLAILCLFLASCATAPPPPVVVDPRTEQPVNMTGMHPEANVTVLDEGGVSWEPVDMSKLSGDAVTDAMRTHQREAMRLNGMYGDDRWMIEHGVNLVAAGKDCDAILVTAPHLDDEVVAAIHNRPYLGPGTWWEKLGFRGVAYQDRNGFLKLYGNVTRREVTQKWTVCPEAFN